MILKINFHEGEDFSYRNYLRLRVYFFKFFLFFRVVLCLLPPSVSPPPPGGGVGDNPPPPGGGVGDNPPPPGGGVGVNPPLPGGVGGAIEVNPPPLPGYSNVTFGQSTNAFFHPTKSFKFGGKITFFKFLQFNIKQFPTLIVFNFVICEKSISSIAVLAKNRSPIFITSEKLDKLIVFKF